MYLSNAGSLNINDNNSEHNQKHRTKYTQPYKIYRYLKFYLHFHRLAFAENFFFSTRTYTRIRALLYTIPHSGNRTKISYSNNLCIQ